MRSATSRRASRRCRGSAARSWLDGHAIEVDTGATVVRGVAAGLADDGSLLVDTDAGRIALGHGEVVRVVTASALPA